MLFELPTAGAAHDDIVQLVIEVWTEQAAKAGIDLSGFNAASPLDERIAWARANGLEIGCVLSRFSSKLQQSTAAQVRECIHCAAGQRFYVPPEYVCVDEAVSGRKSRRDGLDRI